jgi:hypothetical protein
MTAENNTVCVVEKSRIRLNRTIQGLPRNKLYQLEAEMRLQYNQQHTQ